MSVTGSRRAVSREDSRIGWLPMAWAEQAARSLTETFDGSFEAADVAVAAAGVDRATVATHASQGVPPDGRFEIGSVTKTMTATLLALLAADGTLSLDDGIGRWLTAGANGGITLRQLATHTSGLPGIAPNFRPADPDNFWATFTPELAEEGLRQTAIAPGARVYSNFGYQLLGLVLERASGRGYAELIAERLLGPLSMTCSGVGQAGGGIPLPGHTDGREARHWDRPLPGAGGVEATIGDLARYARACLYPPPTPLGAALTAAQAPQLTVEPGREQALGWIVVDGRLRGHSGGTGGFSSSVLIDPGEGRGVAIMVSSRGYSDALVRAARLALAGGDPGEARPQPVGPEWEARARAVVQALLDGRTAEVYAAAAPRFRGRIPFQAFDRAWASRSARAAGAGPAAGAAGAEAIPGRVTVRCQRRGGQVTADVTIFFAHAPLLLRVGFSGSGEVAGLAFPPPPPPG
jgi:CubicO group peptidase (beta-lactamase class C family)